MRKKIMSVKGSMRDEDRGVVHDVVREEGQRKQEEEESSEKQRPRASKILDKRLNRKECKTKLRIFRSAVGSDMASREEDEERTVANQSRKRDKSQRSIWTACSRAPRKEDKT